MALLRNPWLYRGLLLLLVFANLSWLYRRGEWYLVVPAILTIVVPAVMVVQRHALAWRASLLCAALWLVWVALSWFYWADHAIAIAALALIVIAFVTMWQYGRSHSPDDLDVPEASALVLLLAGKKRPELARLGKLVGKAWGCRCLTGPPPETMPKGRWASLQQSPKMPDVFVLTHSGGGLFHLEFGEGSLDDDLPPHRSHFSVSCQRMMDDRPAIAVQRDLGKLAAALLFYKPKAILCPELGSGASTDAPELAEILRSDNPFLVFGAQQHAATDPEILRAARELAQAQWPDFVEAWERGEAEGASVKACFSEGEAREWLWVAVNDITGSRISGQIDNDPVHLQQQQAGAAVTLQVKQVDDWLFQDGSGVHGNFYLQVAQGTAGGA